MSSMSSLDAHFNPIYPPRSCDMKMRLFVGIVLVLGFIGVALPVAGQTVAA